MKILFVCTGNTCRSPMCEAYFRKLCKSGGRTDIAVASAGTFAGDGGFASEESAAVMKEYGIDLAGFASSALTPDLLKNADLIITMTSGHRMQIGSILPEALQKAHLLMEFSSQGGRNVNDPIGGDKAAYSSCFKEMKEALDNLYLDLNKISGKGKA